MKISCTRKPRSEGNLEFVFLSIFVVGFPVDVSKVIKHLLGFWFWFDYSLRMAEKF